MPAILADLAAFKRESEQLAADVDGFDFLVDNAAIDPVEPIEAYSLEDFLAVQTINADAAFVLRQTLAPHMKRKRAAACERRHVQGAEEPRSSPIHARLATTVDVRNGKASTHRSREELTMIKTFVAIGLGAVIVCAPLAAMAQSAAARPTRRAAALTAGICATAATRIRRGRARAPNTCA